MVYLSRNPIYSLMFLILTFISTAFCLFVYLDIPVFIPLAFLLIYVGAIAILFLFVLMLVNLRNNQEFTPWFSLVAYTFFIAITITLFSLANFQQNVFYDRIFDLTLFSPMFEPHLFFFIGLLLAGPLFTVIGIVKQDYVPLARIQDNVTQTNRSNRTVGIVNFNVKKMAINYVKIVFKKPYSTLY